MNENDDGQRVERRNRKKVKTTATPTNLMEVEQGRRVVIVLEAGAHLGGPGDKDGPTDRLCRIVDPRTGVTGKELYNMPRAIGVACVRVDDFDVEQNKER